MQQPSKFQAWNPAAFVSQQFLLSRADMALNGSGKLVDLYVTDVYMETTWEVSKLKILY